MLYRNSHRRSASRCSPEVDLVWTRTDTHRGQTLTLSETDLRSAGLDDQFDAIDEAIADHLDGVDSNVAVIAEPFAGRDVLVEYTDDAFGAAAQQVSYEHVLTDPAELRFPNAEVVVIDGCHYLYTRQIGGYDVLDAFLAEVVERETMFVTAWNRYAWEYLTEIRDVEHVFPVQIRIPRLDSTAISELLVTHYGPEMPEFVQTGEAGRVKSLGVSREKLSVGDWSLDVPVPELNLEYITSRSQTEQYGDVEAVVFQKLTYLAEGNPGVACALWERSVRNGKIAPASVEEVEDPLDIDHDEAFLLEVVLTKGNISIQQLEQILTNVPVSRALGTLEQKGVLNLTDDLVRLVPERLHATAEHLRGRQLIW